MGTDLSSVRESLKERLLLHLTEERTEIYEEDWVALLPAIIFAMNNTHSRATGLSPNELVFGAQLRFPEPRPIAQKWLTSKKKRQNIDQFKYFENLKGQLDEVRAQGRRQKARYEDRSRGTAGKPKKPQKFK